MTKERSVLSIKGVSEMNEKANQATTPVEVSQAQVYDMIVFCHLRWQFVYQRPQHLITRLAKAYRVLFVEEPIHFSPEEENTAMLQVISDQLHILQPKVRSIQDIPQVLEQYVANNKLSVGWFYSPSFVPVLTNLQFDTIVYDCMDELSMFRGAPMELVNQEKLLLAEASIVFTGGKSLYESKRQVHPNVHCFKSSVEQEHFAKAQNGIMVADDISCIKGPIVGYFGVIDERLNLALLEEVARLKPEISFVMIGPMAKISDEDLPKSDNIHYLGMKSYERLPHYLKGFDIAMMPFALNDATKFISPTKTLEYMAAGKPIISTPVYDVVRDYDHCVSIIETAQEFSDAIDRLLSADDSFSLDREYNQILTQTSWNNTANEMKTLIQNLK